MSMRARAWTVMTRKNWIVIGLALGIGLIGVFCTWWLTSPHARAVPLVRTGMSYTEVDRLMQRNEWCHTFPEGNGTYTWTDGRDSQFLEVDFDGNNRCKQTRYWRR